MKAGKLPASLLRTHVLERLRARRPEVVVRAGVGEDAAVLDLGRDLVVIAADPITGADQGAGELAVDVACNDLAAMGAEPVGILVTALFPEATSIDAISRTMDEIEGAAARLNIEVIGGHTEITSLVNAPILMMAAVGRVPAKRLKTASGARPGDALILTKTAGLEGTAILATDFADRLHDVPAQLVEAGRAMMKHISSVRDGLIAARHDVSALHDVTEGGVLGAAWELAEAAGCGVQIIKSDVPVHEATEVICRHLDLDPLRLIASGCMLIATPDPESVIAALTQEGIVATRIGSMTEHVREVIDEEGKAVTLVGPIEDELWRFLQEA